MKKTLILILVSIAVFSCSQAKQAENKNQGPYLAKVNNTPITVTAYKDEFNALPEEAKQAFTAQDVSPFLDEIVKKEIVYQEAVKKGLENDKRVQDALADFKKLVMVNALLKDAVGNKVTVSEDEVKKYYEDNKQNFKINAPGKPNSGKIVDYASVRDYIRQRLTRQKQQMAVAEYVDGLKKASKVEINQEELNKLSSGLSNSPHS